MLPALRRTRSQTKQASLMAHEPVNKRRNTKMLQDNSIKSRPVFIDITNANSKLSELETKKTVSNRNKTNQECKMKPSLSCEDMIVDEEYFQAQSPSSLHSSSFSGGTPSYATADESIESPSDEKLTNSSPSQDQKLDQKSDEMKSVIWPGVDDFDEENRLDAFSVAEYAMDIFNYYKEREKLFVIPKYIHKQLQITKNMRTILVNWLVELQDGFELNHEALYLAVKIVDLYLSRKMVDKHRLQLVGATAVFIASKFDERSPPAVHDFLYICDDAYSKRELILTEIDILKTLKFDLGIPLSYSFLRRYARCAKLPMETLTLARYVLELSLTDYEIIDIPDSLTAAAALLVALKMKNLKWTKTLHYYSGYAESEILDTARWLNKLLTSQRRAEIIVAKYSHKVFFEVAKTPTVEI